jgi:AraC-like DNA-binding protein
MNLFVVNMDYSVVDSDRFCTYNKLIISLILVLRGDVVYKITIPKQKESSDVESDEFLRINVSGSAIGSYKRFGGDCRIYREEGRVDWQIQLVIEGVIDLFDGNEWHSLKEGDCFVLPPSFINDYIYRTDNTNRKTVGYYVHFCGMAVDELMTKAGLNGFRVLRSVSGEVKRSFESLIYARKTENDISALGSLIKIIAAVTSNKDSSYSNTELLVRKQASYINQNYNKEIDYNKMAAKCNLSRSWFTHVFTDIFGVPPTLYQLNLKLEQAGELLKCSNLSVNEVAMQCGFNDPLYFSRAFKKAFGISPSEYKKK